MTKRLFCLFRGVEKIKKKVKKLFWWKCRCIKSYADRRKAQKRSLKNDTNFLSFPISDAISKKDTKMGKQLRLFSFRNFPHFLHRETGVQMTAFSFWISYSQICGEKCWKLNNSFTDLQFWNYFAKLCTISFTILFEGTQEELNDYAKKNPTAEFSL